MGISIEASTPPAVDWAKIGTPIDPNNLDPATIGINPAFRPTAPLEPVDIPTADPTGLYIPSAQVDPNAVGIDTSSQDAMDWSQIGRPVVGDGTRQAPAIVDAPHDVARAADLVADPTPAQRAAGNYQMGHIKWNGLNISIETPKGGTRVAKDGSWETPNFPAHYGRIKGSVSGDGSMVDVYMGDDPSSRRVFVLDQTAPETGKFDEHKVILGVKSMGDAASIYAAAVPDAQSRISGGMVMSVPQFKNWLKTADTTKPVSRVRRRRK